MLPTVLDVTDGSIAVAQALTELQQVMDQALTYTRTLIAQLSPPIQNEFGLPMALRWLAEQMQQRDFTVSLELGSDTLPLPEDQARLLYQSARELIINVIKHGQTDHATVTVTVVGGVLRIAVTDQGVGFNLAAAAKASRIPHFGLFSIRERMKALGGDFELRSRPGEGTQATLVLPLVGASADQSAELKVLSSELAESKKSSELKVLSSELEDRSPESAERFQAQIPTPDNSKLITQNLELQAHKVRVLLVDDHAMVRQGLKHP